MVANSISAGGFKGITGKNIILDDGLFEVTLLKKPRNALELQDMIASLLSGKKCKNIISFKASRLKFLSNEKVNWTLDGEYGGNPKKVLVKNHKCAVKVMSGLTVGRKERLVNKVKDTLNLDK